MTLKFEHISKAAEMINGGVVETPMEYSRTLSKITGAEVFIKFENLQFTSSFKDRGALVKLQGLSKVQQKQGIIAVSAGNHSQGVAYHAEKLGIPTTIVMPRTTPYSKISQTKDFGAEVLLHGEHLGDCSPYADNILKERDLSLIHPYDDEEIISGQGTVGLEMLKSKPDLEVLIVPVGGGGLIAGCSIAAKAINPNIEIIGAETVLYPSLYQRLNGHSSVIGGATIAEGIAVKSIGKIPYEICNQLVSEVLLVCEINLERAICLYLEVEKTVVEGAGAASLGALLCNVGRFKGKKVGLVLSGGNIDSRLLAQIVNRNLVRSGRIVSLRIEITDVPGTLAQVSSIVGQSGGNIIEVRHQRLFTDLPAKGAELDLMIEAPDQSNAQEMIQNLKKEGFIVHILSGESGKNSLRNQ